MILGIWRHEKRRLERVVVQSHLMRKQIENSLASGDWLEFEAETELDFERMERGWRARIEPIWV